MKKKLGIGIATLVGAVVIGAGVYQASADDESVKANKESIQQLVQNEYGGKISEMELEREAGKAFYEVEVYKDGVEYDLIVDADTGEVIREDYHFDGLEKDDENDGKRITQSSVNILSVDEVKAIAQKEFDGTVTEVDLDEDDNVLKYELELKNGNQEAELEIHAKTGEILEMEIDEED